MARRVVEPLWPLGRIIRPVAHSPRLRTATAFALVLLAVSVGGSTAASAKSPYRRGEKLQISGTVVDGNGEPVAGVDVVLVAAKRQFAIGSFRRDDSAEATLDGASDDSGRFALDWTWNRYYNAFRIEAVIRLGGEDGATVDYVVGSLDVTSAVKSRGVTGLELTIDRMNTLANGRAFLASLESDDLRSIYKDMGKPDRVDRLELAKGVEVAWWYFERGRSYHFLDGELESKV